MQYCPHAGVYKVFWSQVTCCCSGWGHLGDRRSVLCPGVLVSWCQWWRASRRLYLVTPFQNTGPGTHRYMVQCRYWCSAPCSVCLDITLLEILDSVPARVRGPRVLSHVAGSVPWRLNGLCPDHHLCHLEVLLTEGRYAEHNMKFRSNRRIETTGYFCIHVLLY